MADLKLINGANVQKTYTNVETIAVPTVNGSTQIYETQKTRQEVAVALDLSSGLQEVIPDSGKVISKVTIAAPETLKSENIIEGVEIAGVTGTATGGTSTEIIVGSVELDMSNGDQVVTADEGTAYSTLTIEKPETLVAENIRKGVRVAGMTGTYAGDGTGGGVAVQANYEQNDSTQSDYILNRPFYKIDEPNTPLFEMQELTADETKIIDNVTVYVFNLAETIELVEGVEYTFSTSTTTFASDECKKYSPEGGEEILYIGSLSILTETSTRPGWAVATTSSGVSKIYTVSSNTDTFGITYYKKEFKQMNPKFIPDMYYDNNKANAELLPETPLPFCYESGVYITGIDLTKEQGELFLSDYKTATVVWDDIEYKCPVMADVNFVIIGNISLAMGTGDDGIPFLLEAGYEDGGYALIALSLTDPIPDDTSNVPTIEHRLKINADIIDFNYIDPKFIKDMYYSTKGGSWKTIIENQTVTCVQENETSYSAIDPFSLTLTIGDTYKVIWDGTEYECICVADGGAPYIGDIEVSSGNIEGASIPFLIGVMGATVFVYGSEGDHTVEIQQPGEVINHIKPKYIKDMYYTEQEGKDVLPSQDLEFVSIGDNMYQYPGDSLFGIEPDKIYEVTWDGTTYECVGVKFVPEPGFEINYIGDLYIAEGVSNAGREPFFIYDVLNEGMGAIATLDTSATHKVSIKLKDIIHQIDVKYIPTVVMLPAYTDDDEGKVLKIVNGVPTWVSLE